jgi:hypothetical protein
MAMYGVHPAQILDATYYKTDPTPHLSSLASLS